MRIGIDLGGTKIEGIALDDAGAALCRRRVATPGADYAAIIDTIAGLVSSIEQQFGQNATVGVGSPGSLSLRSGVIRNSNSTVLNGKPLDRDLERALGRPVRLENDANCFTLSEAIDGAGTDAESVFGVILGTGVGGGLVIGKRLLRGRNRIAGEWGHNPLPWPRGRELPGPRCYCGKRGCIETFISGPALSRDFRVRSGRNATAAEISTAAGAGDRDASAVFEMFEDRLARGLAMVINIFDPDKIVLGGGLSNLARVYETVPALVGRYAFSDAIDTQVVRAAFGDSSGVRGAAWLWPV